MACPGKIASKTFVPTFYPSQFHQLHKIIFTLDRTHHYSCLHTSLFYPRLSTVSLFRVHDVGKNNLTKLGKPAELLAPRISSFLTT